MLIIFFKASIGCVSNVSSIFKASAVLPLLSYLNMVQWSIWDLTSNLLLNTVVKVCGMLIRVRFLFYIGQGFAQESINKIIRFFLSVVSLVLSSGAGFHLLVFWQETALLWLGCLQGHMAKDRRRGENISTLVPPPWRCSSTQGKDVSRASVWAARSTGYGMQWKRKKRRGKNSTDLPHFLWSLRAFFFCFSNQI